MARPSERRCAITATPLTPSRTAPPNSRQSARRRTARSLGRISSPPRGATGSPLTASRMLWKTNSADGRQLGPDQQPAEGRDGVALDRVSHALEDELGGTLGGLDEDVAAEAVGDHDIGLSLEDVLAFDVADEIDPFEAAEEWFTRLHQLVALADLLTVAE